VRLDRPRSTSSKKNITHASAPIAAGPTCVKIGRSSTSFSGASLCVSAAPAAPGTWTSDTPIGLML
jgi:hypothetical protein